MKPEDIQLNSVGMVLSINDEGEMSVAVLSNLTEEFDAEHGQILVDTINGLNAILTSGMDFVITYGATLRYLKEEMEFNEGAIVFEPDEEFEQAVADAKVIKFDKSRLN